MHLSSSLFVFMCVLCSCVCVCSPVSSGDAGGPLNLTLIQEVLILYHNQLNNAVTKFNREKLEQRKQRRFILKYGQIHLSDKGN